MRAPFTRRTIDVIRSIPPGRVLTYGTVAALAGDRRAARQVARVLHSCSEADGLPWHRVVGREGRVALRDPDAGAEQRRLLEQEGIAFDARGRLDLERFLWVPGRDGPA